MPRHCTFLRSMEIIQFFAGCQNNSIFLAGNCHDKIQSNFNARWAGGTYKGITRKGSHKSQKLLNALTRLNCDQREFQEQKVKNEDISRVLQISMKKN